MAFDNKLLSIFKLAPDDEDYDDMIEGFDSGYDDDYVDEAELRREEKRREREEKRLAKEEAKRARERERDSSYDYEEEPKPRRTSFRTSSNKVIPMKRASNGMDVCIVKPQNFGASQEVCECLLDGQLVVVNLEGIDIMEAQRIMDFISGCIFSISGNMRQVSRYIFVFAPQHIDISGDYIKSVAEGSGLNIPNLGSEF